MYLSKLTSSKMFSGLIDKTERMRAACKLTHLYEAEAIIIFVKDPELDEYIVAPGFSQTIPDGAAWQRLLKNQASDRMFNEVFCPLGSKQKKITLISYDDTIIFTIIEGTLTDSQINDIHDALPFLSAIFTREKTEQYFRMRLSDAEKSVAENQTIASKLDTTRRELHKALIKTREEFEAIKKAQEFKDRVDSLTKQRNELIRLNEIKDEFISIASHQLRTPATVAKQYMGLLLEGYAGELTPLQLHYLKVAYEGNEVQLDILNDLLKTAQLDSADAVLQKKKQPISRVTEKIINQLSVTISLKKQRILFETTDYDLEVPINEDEIKLALTNLIENASKYSHPGKKISVKLYSDKRSAYISIKDEGVGMEKKDFDKIFDKFTRADNELSDAVSGSGLGLYLVKRIVDLHGGKITIASVVGQGSVFTIKLPL